MDALEKETYVARQDPVIEKLHAELQLCDGVGDVRYLQRLKVTVTNHMRLEQHLPKGLCRSRECRTG